MIINNTVGETVDTAQSKRFCLLVCFVHIVVLYDDDDYEKYSMMLDTAQG